jgi:hypothetical protein
MKTLSEIFLTYGLSTLDIVRLSKEAKTVSIDCGKKGVIKELSLETWDLFDEISNTI